MARLLRKRTPPVKVEMIASDDVTGALSAEFGMSKEKVLGILRSVGISLDGKNPASEMNLYREVIACKKGDTHRFKNTDEAYEASLDEQLRSFDEIYVDTAPIIQEDWFLHFVSDAEPILKRRKKKLIILEKTLEELHGLKDNQEKDKEVRIRSTIRPEMIRTLARKGLVRIGDTGSVGIADDHLVKLFAAQGKTKNLMLITQDRGLSERIVNLSQTMGSESVTGLQSSFLKRLFGGKKNALPKSHQMVACKLIEEGKLKRCYICPECKESYYDDLFDCEGSVLCGRCYLELKEKDAKVEAEQLLQKELEVKKEEELQRKLQMEAEAAQKEQRQVTVQQILDRKKRKYLLVGVVLGIVAVLVILLVLHVF
ncbi:hypothetical protein [uncultured Sphaerochaeta sp.]|uniref:hypothetical protein n=1 Tax=uncultured Sphaerochaeta sp. TaxID=886478 RepID=UPI002A0A7B39|nr:hypothetical protein [uncultured Sphaerochaeta sp.]